MEYELIQRYKAEIKQINKDNKDKKENQIKEGIALYSLWMQVLLWSLFALCVGSIITFIVLTLISNPSNRSLLSFWICFCCIVALSSMTIIVLLSSVFSNLYSKEGLESCKKRLDVLEKVIISTYSGEALLNKVDALIEIYQADIDSIIAEENKRNKSIGAALTVMGTIVLTSFEGMEKIGINIDGWLVFVLCLIIMGFLTIAPMYLITLINPIKDKYRLMLKRLKHLRIMLIKDEC